jgi:uncharacterized protein YukE
MSDLKQLDIEAGRAVVSAFATNNDFLATMLSSVQSAANTVLETWNGTSRAQFESVLSDFVTTVNLLKQNLEAMKNNLQNEVIQVEDAFRV